MPRKRGAGVESLVGITDDPWITGLWGGYPDAEQFCLSDSQLGLWARAAVKGSALRSLSVRRP